ncbi:MAG: AHH domain-containing protein [Endozoicomonas sp.]|uniref:AHH domain-containing protein n=1 Tax=Endozoicomonas sp. TaxID=1892382 RepID=UPI003D9BEDE0
MPVPERTKKYYEKDRLELQIDRCASKKDPTTFDYQQVQTVADIETKLDLYRWRAQDMSARELRKEHHQSSRLAEHMAIDGYPRPHSLCDAHAIVSGAHKRAAQQRALLASLKLRVDDPFNGCWLPRNTAAIQSMPRTLRSAVPHSRIHRTNYYRWLDSELRPASIRNVEVLKQKLKMVETRLQAGTQPKEVMEKASRGKKS